MDTDTNPPQGAADQTDSGETRVSNDDANVRVLLEYSTDRSEREPRVKVRRRPSQRAIKLARYQKRWFRTQLMSPRRDELLSGTITAEKVIQQARVTAASLTFSPVNDQ